MAALLLTLSLQNMKMHTAKRNTEMQDSECPTLRDLNIYTVIHTDIYLKNLLLQNEAALKQQRLQKHSDKLTFQEFQASTNIQSCKSKQLHLKNFNHSLKQRKKHSYFSCCSLSSYLLL